MLAVIKSGFKKGATCVTSMSRNQDAMTGATLLPSEVRGLLATGVCALTPFMIVPLGLQERFLCTCLSCC